MGQLSRACAIALCVVAFAAADEAALPLADRFAQAKFDYDLPLAEALLPEFEQLAQSTGTETDSLDYVAASLLVAELRRSDYEHLDLERKERRALGRSIDRVAKDGLAVLATLPDSSERYRMEADLVGTMIRSKYQGMKYQQRLEDAIQIALELDPNNAHAWVSHSRRPLFAPPKYGGDLSLAVDYLNRALAIDPEHTQALLFRGAAYFKMGEQQKAESDWDQALSINPATAVARERIVSIEFPYEDGG